MSKDRYGKSCRMCKLHTRTNTRIQKKSFSVSLQPKLYRKGGLRRAMHDAERLEESRRLGPPVCSPLLGMVLSTAQALIPLFLCQQALRARSEFECPDWKACSSRKRLFDYRRACPRSLAGTTGSDSRSGRSWRRR